MQESLFEISLDKIVDPRHPYVVLAQKIDWQRISDDLSGLFEHSHRQGKVQAVKGLWGISEHIVGAGVSAAGRPRKVIRLMSGLLFLKHLENLSDERVVERWAENPFWQYFCGMTTFQYVKPCAHTTLLRFRRDLGEEGCEALLAQTLAVAMKMKAITEKDLQKIVVDTTVQEKAIAPPTDSRLLEVARYKLVREAKRLGIPLKQTFAREGREAARQASGLLTPGNLVVCVARYAAKRPSWANSLAG